MKLNDMAQNPMTTSLDQLSSDAAAWIVHNVAPLRAAPDGDSEQVSQAILGDCVIWLDERDNYVRVRMTDGYEGWVWHEHLRMIHSVPGAAGRGWVESLRDETSVIHYVSCGITDLYGSPTESETRITKLVLGTRLRVLGTWFAVHDNTRAGREPHLKVETPFVEPGESVETTTIGYVAARDTMPGALDGYQGGYSGAAACALALRFVGTPYLWGGTTPFGFDCSGFVQRIYGMLNVPLPRDAYLQARASQGVTLTPDRTLEAGDLIFFCGRSDPHQRGITHVGMALDEERFIHAYGKRGVVITRFDDPSCRTRYTYVSAWRCGASSETSSDVSICV
jgi:hypothetical protein